MSRARALVILVACCCGPTLTTASAQDLFELEVFPNETTLPGDYDVSFHTNAMSAGSLNATSPLSNHRPVHLSVEVTRGWTDIFETAVDVGSGWELSISAGHCVTSNEPWLMKSVFGYRF
jgi:hypothetical protein